MCNFNYIINYCYTQLQVSIQILELTEMNEPAGEENNTFLSLGISMKLIIFRICLKPRYSPFLWEYLWTPSSNHLIYLCSNSTSNTNKQWCLIIYFRVSLRGLNKNKISSYKVFLSNFCKILLISKIYLYTYSGQYIFKIIDAVVQRYSVKKVFLNFCIFFLNTTWPKSLFSI